MPAAPLERQLRPRKSPRQARAVETRARILDAARAVFAEHGYAAGTTNRIAEAASLSVGSLYQYFPNKDAILVELVHEHIDEGRAALAGLVVDGTGVAAAIHAVVGALVDLHAGDRRLHQVLFEESPRPRSLVDRLRAAEDEAVGVVAALLAGAGVGGDDPALRARIVVATVESLVHRLVADDRPLDRDRVVDEITRLVTGYLGT